jgi:DNA-binding XRE family transcriptional regulator
MKTQTKTIRALRHERGWTQFDLALAIGVRPQTVYLWESGRRQPQVSQMRKLGAVFGICSDDIDLIVTHDAYVLATEQTPADRQDSDFASDHDHPGRALFRASGAASSPHNMPER